jgi:hypothetical protein
MAILPSWLRSILGDDPEAAGAAASSQAMEPVVGGYGRDVASGDYLQQGLASLMGAYGWNPELSPRENAVAMAKDPSQIDAATNVAMGVSGGGLGTKTPKAPSAARSDLPAPNIGKGTETPLFDYSRLTERPDVPQEPVERMPPPAKGVPDWAKSQIEDPAMREQYKAVLKTGREVGGDQNTLGWWNTFPLRERYIGEFGEQAGDAKWRSNMNMWSATSPRTDFPQNIKQGSYFENLLAEGKPLPELVKKYREGSTTQFNWVPTSSAPPGYKNFPMHIQNIENLLQPDRVTIGNQYPLTNPKPTSMAQNLVGNWSVPTVDVRDLRAMGMKTKGGAAMEAVDPTSLYGYIENNFHQPLAKELGMEPAQMQSTTWVGVPEYFKGTDLSGTTPAIGTLEERVRRTASIMGLTPEQVFQRSVLRKEFPLLSAGGAAALMGGSKDDDERTSVK